jgi:aryl-alcohol dehydrogenase-like predicted oxidoreductase
MMFGRRTEPEDSYRIIDRAVEAGINFLDTANVYSRGRSEEVTGEALKRNGKRDRIFLATKVHGKMSDDDPNMEGNSRRHIIAECEASLRRLQTDHIDLYQIHRPQSDIPIDETLRAMDDLIRAGKVRYVGTSTYAAWQVVESLWVSKELGLNRFVCEQTPYNLLDRRVERELLPMAETFGLAIIPWSPLAGGLLTDKYRVGQPLPEGSRFGGKDQTEPMKKRLNEAYWEVLGDLQSLSSDKGVPLSQLALAWVGQQRGVTAPIIGPRTVAQLEDNLKALDVEITGEDRARLDGICQPGRVRSPFYEADFGPHQYR